MWVNHTMSLLKNNIREGSSPGASVDWILALCSLITIGTVAGNIATMASIIVYRRLYQPQNLLLVSLAVADLQMGLVIMPLKVLYEHMGWWPLGKTVCLFWTSMMQVSVSAAVLNLCAIAMDLYWELREPVRYQNRRKARHLCAMIAVVWALSLLCGVGPLMGWTELPISVLEDPHCCRMRRHKDFIIYLNVVHFLLPSIIFYICFVKIKLLLQRRSVKLKTILELSMASNDSLGHRKVSQIYRSRRRPHTEQTAQQRQRIEHSKEETREQQEEKGESHFEKDEQPEEISEQPGGKGERPKTTGEEPEKETEKLQEIVKEDESIEENYEVDNQQQDCKDVGTEAGPIYHIPETSAYVERRCSSDADDVGGPRCSIVSRGTDCSRCGPDVMLQQRKAVSVLGLQLMVSTLCQLPVAVNLLVESLCPECLPHSHVRRDTLVWILFSKSFLNPLLYTTVDGEMRRALRRLMLCRPQQAHTQ